VRASRDEYRRKGRVVRGEGRGTRRKRNSEPTLNADERRTEQINADYEVASIKRRLTQAEDRRAQQDRDTAKRNTATQQHSNTEIHRRAQRDTEKTWKDGDKAEEDAGARGRAVAGLHYDTERGSPCGLWA
jgi:hypothetical protein